MHIQRIKAVQAHPVPSQVYRPGNIFDADVLRAPVIDRESVEEPEFPPGATPANGMQGVPLFRCNVCDAIVAESELDAHRC